MHYFVVVFIGFILAYLVNFSHLTLQACQKCME